VLFATAVRFARNGAVMERSLARIAAALLHLPGAGNVPAGGSDATVEDKKPRSALC